jgi:hypothetical protein
VGRPGAGNRSTGNFVGQVIRSADFGQSWQEVWRLPPDGTLYAAGPLVTSVIKSKGSTTHVTSSLIRRSTDGGLSGTTVIQTSRRISGLAVGANGRVCASYDHSVEVSSNQGTSWVVSDIFSPFYSERLVADALGISTIAGEHC